MSKVEAYQISFVEYVTKIESESKIQHHFNEQLDEKTKHRLSVYQESFRGRAISSLTDIMLNPLCLLFSEQVVKEIVARYFSVFPPKVACMISALNHLPEFVSKNKSDWFSLFFSHMVELCLEYQKFIVSEDTNQFYFFETKENICYYEAWTFLYKNKIDSYKVTNLKSATSILFVKLQPNYVVSLRVPFSLNTFIPHFMKTKCAQTSLDALTDEEIEFVCEEELENFLIEIKNLFT